MIIKQENMFSRETYKERRRVLSAAMGKGLILLLGNSESGMNYKDNVYPFRQDSSFLYFLVSINPTGRGY
jgi:Xaa-Pro aminopeptidase